MDLQEYIEFYENELEKQEIKKQGILEVGKNTNYIDKKIEHNYNLLRILRNCQKTETIAREKLSFGNMKYMIEEKLKAIDLANNEELEKQETRNLLEKLRKAIEEEW